jgi:hypothetical protein
MLPVQQAGYESAAVSLCIDGEVLIDQVDSIS